MDGIEVKSTKKLSRFSMDGDPEVYFRVAYVTSKRASGIIEIPEADFTKEALPGILEEERDRANLAFTLANGD